MATGSCDPATTARSNCDRTVIPPLVTPCLLTTWIKPARYDGHAVPTRLEKDSERVDIRAGVRVARAQSRSAPAPTQNE